MLELAEYFCLIVSMKANQGLSALIAKKKKKKHIVWGEKGMKETS